MFTTLEDVRADAENRLIEAGRSRHTPMHTPVVGTQGGAMRVMVLREYDPHTRTLRFHTDARSPKCAEIGAGAPVGVLAYDPAEKIQIRLRGQGRIETDTPLADEAWDESTTFARRCYLAEDAPGHAVADPTSGLPDWVEGIKPGEDQVAPARENFAVLLIKVETIDWLYLANSGHRRAQFDLTGDDIAGEWVIP